ncbi:hypothetical protein [Dyadobacter sp. NIV53]|uniref:hypothetical protein n=1 Tax=Dyadobacter sp. NIV53 TaxID=2861765 RepID=UPI001C870C87|nr:hypothetical protein [Dyadobacter sp. NIV53]
MKKLIIAIALVFIGIESYSQDKIITHNQDTINCKVIETQETSVKYKYLNEDAINSISKNTVYKILFASGREQIISEKVIINSENDWSKVQITNNESEVAGLLKLGEIHAKANSGWSMTNAGKMQTKALKKLKQEAAEKGAHLVLILTQTSKNGSYGMSGGTKASFTGVAYGYSKH